MYTQERSNLRPNHYSIWHRKLNKSLGFCDLDIILTCNNIIENTWIECNFNKPLALFEVKLRFFPFNFNSFFADQAFIKQIKVLDYLANNRMPSFITLHDELLKHFAVFPANRLAKELLYAKSHLNQTNGFVLFDELEYVELLHELRGIKPNKYELLKFMD